MPTIYDDEIPRCCGSAMRAVNLQVHIKGRKTTARAGWLCLYCQRMMFDPSPTYIETYGHIKPKTDGKDGYNRTKKRRPKTPKIPKTDKTYNPKQRGEDSVSG